MSYDTEDRDNSLRANHGIQSWDSQITGVEGYDSQEVAYQKVQKYRQQSSVPLQLFDIPRSSESTSGGYSGPPLIHITGKNVLRFFLFLFFVAIALIAWSAKDEFFAYIKKAQRDQAAVERIEEFSNFSHLSEWPQRVQETYAKQEGKSLVKLLDEIPSNLTKISSAKREILGAQIWFKISSKGLNASDYLVTAQDTPHRVKSPILRAASLSIHFLKMECDRGVELACLDAAKSFAGLVWNGREASQEGWIIERALEHLPTSGPLSKSSAIESLRKKISDVNTDPAQ